MVLFLREVSVELKMPSPEQAYWGLRAMKTVALADVLDDSERHMMEAVRRFRQLP